MVEDGGWRMDDGNWLRRSVTVRNLSTKDTNLVTYLDWPMVGTKAIKDIIDTLLVSQCIGQLWNTTLRCLVLP
jgi:hypothetical protein